MIGELGDAVQRDPEVRQARMIADAARSRLLDCVTGPQEAIDLTEAQRMLEALGNAQAHAEDAEDRVLLHRGLLTPAEASRRAAHRRPASRRPGGPGEPERAGIRKASTHEAGIHEAGIHEAVTLRNVLRVIAAGLAPVAAGLAPVAAGLAAMALARRLGVRLPRVRR